MTNTFVPPTDLRDIHTIYTAEPEKTSDPAKWPQTHVRVFHTAVDGTRTQVHEYGRNYSMLKTFEPFRQLADGVWHDYALISPSYSTFAVLDLESFEVVATRPYPQRDWYTRVDPPYSQYEKMRAERPEAFEPGGYWAGKGPTDQINGEGFCPRAFYVPDITEELHGAPNFDGREQDAWFAASVAPFQGQFGFVAGCVWGDDSSDKLRYIDLSKISDGIVTEDERFGYWELPYGPLRDSIRIEDGDLNILTSIRVDISTGRASKYVRGTS